MRKKFVKSKNCPLDNQSIVIDYKDTELLSRFVSERGKILSRARSGICARHQRQITRAIKRARYMALMPFVQR